MINSNYNYLCLIEMHVIIELCANKKGTRAHFKILSK